MKYQKSRPADNGAVMPPKYGELLEGKIVERTNSAVFLDLGQKGVGIIYGRDYIEAKEFLKDLKVGQSLFAKVVETDNEDGYIELSLAQAQKELLWRQLEGLKEKGEAIKVKIVGANKGGLLARLSGIDAFLPVSKLSPEHYPKVPGGESSGILRELQKFVGQELEVKVFDVAPKQQRLIICEKVGATEIGATGEGEK
jgi:small subunit ribosomal protein S1